MRYGDRRDGDSGVEGEREYRRQKAADAEPGHGGDAAGRNRHNEEKRLEHEWLPLGACVGSPEMAVTTVGRDGRLAQPREDSTRSDRERAPVIGWS
jgi:hypothetical protein